LKYDIKNASLAPNGKLRIEWAERNMPVLGLVRKRFEMEKPLRNVRIGCCLHVTTETANLMLTLKSAGASVSLCASNPLSTQDDVAACLVKDYRIPVYAVKGEDSKRYYSHINAVLDTQPHITMDDGADLVSTIHSRRRDLAKNVLAGTEETTTGVIRLKSLEEKGLLLFSIFAVNNASTKHLFDNRYGTGQSTVDGIIRSTNILLAGLNFVVCGYGWCGRGVAMRARGMGANVIVSEVQPVRALEAVMDGYRVMPAEEASKTGDVFVTLTGNTTVLTDRHFRLMKDGAIVCNSGHFDVEINIPALAAMSKSKRRIRALVDEYTLKNGKKIYLLGEGRLVNLASAEGHPASVMDMSFANQALCAEHIKKHERTLQKKVYDVPKDIDNNIASLKLKAMNIRIDSLTPRQKRYLSSWEEGT
jgi:adenosylhomocysteinase